MSMKSKERRGHKGLCEDKGNIKQGQDKIRDSSNLKWPQIAAAYNKRNHKISLNSKYASLIIIEKSEFRIPIQFYIAPQRIF